MSAVAKNIINVIFITYIWVSLLSGVKLKAKRGELAKLWFECLDTRGLSCPLPLAELKKTINRLAADSIILMRVSDPSFVLDLRVYLKLSGHILHKAWQEQDFYYLLEIKLENVKRN